MIELLKEIGRGKRGARDLTYEEAARAAELIVGGAATPAQIGAFLVAERVKMESADELKAFGDLVVHYQAPLSDGDRVFMVRKGGVFTPCEPEPDPTKACRHAADFHRFESQTWSEVGYAWQGDQLVEQWSFASDWKPPLGEEVVFQPVIAGDRLVVPMAEGAVAYVDPETGEPHTAAMQSALVDGARNAPQPGSGRDPDRYDSVARFFHWVFAVGIIYASVAGYTLTQLADGPLRDFLSRLNMSLATVLIVLFPLRVIWRFVRVEPQALAGVSAGQRVLAHGVHTLLYLVILVVLASGFLMVPNGYSFFGLIEIHTPFAKGALTGKCQAIHHAGCAVLAGLVVLHVLAVAKHQLIARRDVLRRMA